MVNEFNFIPSTSSGLPDLVLWSHGSAFDSGGTWWKFNGEIYEQVCAWMRKTRRENERGEWEDVKPYTTENTCKQTNQ